MVSDKATYDKIIDQLKSSDDPQFIFDVTMQNHGGYDTGVLSPDLVTQRTVVDYDNPELDEYLALIDISDKVAADCHYAVKADDMRAAVGLGPLPARPPRGPGLLWRSPAVYRLVLQQLAHDQRSR